MPHGWHAYRPEPASEWYLPRTRGEVAEELDLCGVPLDADVKRARALLETNGVWAVPATVTAALAWRRTRKINGDKVAEPCGHTARPDQTREV
ncbi:hypothetical protein [Micromonospora aurantiaca (nom. illeg.)]|uniref:hypothetical protein n=1 Tax=Micromonospora aurantiaca (nom. illeg.) TaxID=47850 RepID=UPI003798A3D4